MTFSLRATYIGGVLKPVHPLPLGEGELVEIVVSQESRDQSEPPTDELEKKIRAASTLDEWVRAANAAPDENAGYDLLHALDANRKHSGDTRLLIPQQ